ncbi:hypothetical protein BGZ94_002993 [Podila epigama]|nr:hypothetical protein BGZ94_002993 [Podila epigama]
MSINWVMLTPDGKDIVPLAGETIFYRKENVKFELDTSNGSSFYSTSGTLLLTNQRVVYVRKEPTDYFTSASLPINNIQDSKLTQPWFSTAVFKAVVMPVPGGGLNQPGRLSISFADGSMEPQSTGVILQLKESKKVDTNINILSSRVGLHEFDFQFRALKERLQELDGAPPEHLEQLPQYDPPSEPLASSSTTITTPPLVSTTTTTTAPAPMHQPLPAPPTTTATTTTTPTTPAVTTTTPPTLTTSATPEPSSSRTSSAPAPREGPIAIASIPTDLPPGYDDIQ